LTDPHCITLADGRVTLYCGEALEILNSGLLRFDAIVTDPPYGIGFQRGTQGNGGIRAEIYRGTIVGDDKPFDPSPWIAAAGDKPMVFFGADHYKTRLPEGGRFLCWDKSCGMGAASTLSDAEFAWTNRRNARSIYRHFWMGATRTRGPHDGIKRAHVSQKPVALMAWCFDHARIGLGKVVLDPYMGSGSTGVAAVLSGRRFIGIECERDHFDAAVSRIQSALAERT